MKYWAKDGGVQFANSSTCFGQEYAVPGAPLNIAVITVKGRYPETGFIYNLEAHEMAYVVSGSGSVRVKDGQIQALATGDTVYFGPMEQIAWDGDMVLVVPCSPAFDPNKHKETQE